MAKVFAATVVSAVATSTWTEWKTEYGKVYNSDDEDAVRKAIFDNNNAIIEESNAAGHSYTMGPNQFSDLTLAEFKAQYLTRSDADVMDMPSLGIHEHNGEELAASIDWTTQGAVTVVKDQGSCGGCWSFAATGALEGATKVAGNSLVSLSEQQFLDCDTTDSGCGGGLEYQGWDFFKSAGQGICTESSYPYKARNGNCAYSSCTLGIKAGGISGVTHVGKTASALQSALGGRPVAIGIQADQSAFQFYTGGILTGSCGTQLDHSVLAVGYTADYWKVKNSWGSSWGESGYVRLSTSGDKCGILDDASYPTVKSGSIEV
jgi:C1A family cysteine protease